MNLLPKITGVGGVAESPVRGNIDDALILDQERKEKRAFSVTFSPDVRGIKIDTSHPLESTVESIGGRVTISIKW